MEDNKIVSLCSLVFPNEHFYCLNSDSSSDLTSEIDELLKTDITFVILTGDLCPDKVYSLAERIKSTSKLKVCWYSNIPLQKDIPLKYFDYIKTGVYDEDLGDLDSVTTNQRFYAVFPKYSITGNQVLYTYLEDITFKFQNLVYEVRNYQDDEE